MSVPVAVLLVFTGFVFKLVGGPVLFCGNSGCGFGVICVCDLFMGLFAVCGMCGCCLLYCCVVWVAWMAGGWVVWVGGFGFDDCCVFYD